MARKGLIHSDKKRLKFINKFTLRAIGNGSDGGPKGPPFKVNGKVNPKVPIISLDLSLDKIKLIDEEEKKEKQKMADEFNEQFFIQINELMNAEEEDEYIDLENFTEEQKQIYEDLLLEIRELRKLIPEEDAQKVKNDEEKEDKEEEE